ncbi:MAG: site-specific DNA-methyltransferase [Methylovulum sp.]
MIYIDPPYNTGNDSFVYPDDYSERQDGYKKRAGITDENGFLNKQDLWKKNTKESGRFHSVWLSMMYPCLYLARNLLREDGAIFISIDDNEQANLKLLCDEIFGEENYVNTICVKAKPSAGASGGGEDKRLKKNIEFLLLYAKNSEEESLDLNQAVDETDLFKHIDSMKQDGKSWKYTRFVDSFGDKKYLKSAIDGDGNEIKIYEHIGYQFVSLSEVARDGISERDFYLNQFNTVFRDTNAQSSIRTRVMEAVGEKDGLFSIEYIPRSGKNKGKKTVVYYKGANKDQLAWLRDIARSDGNNILIRGKTGTLWSDFNWNNVSKEGNTIFPNGKKPIAFIQRMLSISTNPNENHIVLDFFAGSGSAAHAVLDLNEQDGGNRPFICVQLPEALEETSEAYKAGYRTIADICKARISKVIAKLQAERETATQNADLFADTTPNKRWALTALKSPPVTLSNGVATPTTKPFWNNWMCSGTVKKPIATITICWLSCC